MSGNDLWERLKPKKNFASACPNNYSRRRSKKYDAKLKYIFLGEYSLRGGGVFPT